MIFMLRNWIGEMHQSCIDIFNWPLVVFIGRNEPRIQYEMNFIRTKSVQFRRPLCIHATCSRYSMLLSDFPMFSIHFAAAAAVAKSHIVARISFSRFIYLHPLFRLFICSSPSFQSSSSSPSFRIQFNVKESNTLIFFTRKAIVIQAQPVLGTPFVCRHTESASNSNKVHQNGYLFSLSLSSSLLIIYMYFFSSPISYSTHSIFLVSFVLSFLSFCFPATIPKFQATAKVEWKRCKR